MEFTSEQRIKIYDGLLKHLVKKYGPDKLFPERFTLVAEEIGVSTEELMEFLHPYLTEYFGG